ncbi:MAG: ABC transporter substrate-binding protein, partial [Bryobacteraceae bacterium]
MRRTAIAVGILFLTACGGSDSRPLVRVAVGGQAALRFLPVYLARELGLYEKAGMHVTIDSLSGSAKAMQALLGGSADVAAGFYDQTIQIAAEGREVQSFVTLTRYLGFVAAAAPGTTKSIRRIEDLKGAVVGVAAPGSSGHLLLNYLLASRGMQASDVSTYSIGTGATSVTAMQRGTVDAGVIGDLVLSPLLRDNPNLAILADTRSEQGIRATFGVSAYPGSVLYATGDWIRRHEDVVRRLSRVMQQTLRWAREQPAEQVREKLKAVYPGEDPSVLLEALKGTI